MQLVTASVIGFGRIIKRVIKKNIYIYGIILFKYNVTGSS